MDPVSEADDCGGRARADRVELYTEPYARAFGARAEAVLGRYAQRRARAALRPGRQRGHDLNLDNLRCSCAGAECWKCPSGTR